VPPREFLRPGAPRLDDSGVTIEILVPTTRTLGGATRAILDQLLGSGFFNIDSPTTPYVLAELMNVDTEEWAARVPEESSAEELSEAIKADRQIVRVKIDLRVGHFLLFPGFVILCRPDPYEEFETDPRARQIVGREALELAQAFLAPEIVIAGDAASDFLGSEATTWEGLKEVLEEEVIPHTVIPIPARA